MSVASCAPLVDQGKASEKKEEKKPHRTWGSTQTAARWTCLYITKKVQTKRRRQMALMTRKPSEV